MVAQFQSVAGVLYTGYMHWVLICVTKSAKAPHAQSIHSSAWDPSPHSAFSIQAPRRDSRKTNSRMKTSIATIALLAAAVLSGAEAGHHHHHHKQHHNRMHLHQSHHMKFQETDIVADNATCPLGGSVLLCTSLANECTTSGTSQACLPRSTAFLSTIDAQTTGPWQACGLSGSNQPTKCLFSFQCLCHDTANKNCFCLPPDAYRMNRGATPTGCKMTNGTVGCDPGQYCRTKSSKQECATKPYIPGLSLYQQCGGTFTGTCQEGLTCQKKSDKYSLCVKA